MVQDSSLHKHCISLHYAQTQLNISECAFKLNSINTYFWGLAEHKSNFNSNCRLQNIAK